MLQGIPALYVILDMEVLSQSLAGPGNGFWAASFLRLFRELADRGSKTIARVALVSYASSTLKGPFGKDCEDCVVTVGRARQARTPLSKLARRGEGDIGLYEHSNPWPGTASVGAGQGRTVTRWTTRKFVSLIL